MFYFGPCFLESEKNDVLENCDPNSTPASEKSPRPAEDIDCTNTKKTNKAQIETIQDENMESDIKEVPNEMIDFKVVFNKNKYDILFGWDKTVKELKVHLESIIGVVQNAQKIMIKGMAKDEMTLRSAGIVSGCKVMVVGSKTNDILAMTNLRQVTTKTMTHHFRHIINVFCLFLVVFGWWKVFQFY